MDGRFGCDDAVRREGGREGGVADGKLSSQSGREGGREGGREAGRTHQSLTFVQLLSSPLQ